MLAASGRDSLADDNAGIVDGSRHRQDAEIARRKIAERVEIKHLALGEKERVLRVVARGGRSDNHARGIGPLRGHAVSRAGGSAKCA